MIAESIRLLLWYSARPTCIKAWPHWYETELARGLLCTSDQGQKKKRQQNKVVEFGTWECLLMDRPGSGAGAEGERAGSSDIAVSGR